MTLHSDILLDFNNMMADELGEGGILREEIEALKLEVREIHEGLLDLRRLGQLPFQELPSHDELASKIGQKAREIRESYETVLLLGIGGSALGAAFLSKALGKADGLASFTSRSERRAAGSGPELIVCDDLDPQGWNRIADRIDLKKTLLMVVSKSGKTLETWAAFLFFYSRLRDAQGSRAMRQMVIITDPHEGPLRELANRENIASFDVPTGVGGRYSILSPVGLLPAACVGVEIGELLAGARRMDDRCKGADAWFNPALMSAALHHLHAARRGRPIRVTMSYGGSLEGFGPWFAQLWAESLGKRRVLQGVTVHAGSTPISATGPRDQHSQLQLYLDGPDDKVVTFVGTEQGAKATIPARENLVWKEIGRGVKEDDLTLLAGRSVQEILVIERKATEDALREGKRPNQTILLREADAYSIGQLIFMAELETVYTGELYDINPFDQPAVEQIKINIRKYLVGKITPKKSRSYMI